jgi:hypothetical protein
VPAKWRVNRAAGAPSALATPPRFRADTHADVRPSRWFPLSGPATLIGMTEILRQIEASVRSLHDDLIDRRPPKTDG